MTISNVSYLSQDFTAKYLAESFPWNIQVFKMWPFRGIPGFQLSYALRDQIPADTSVLPAETLGTDAALLNYTDSPDDQAAYNMGELARRAIVPYTQRDRYTVPNNLHDVEIQLGLRRLIYTFFKKITRAGSTADGDFEGLLGTGLLDPTQKITMDDGGGNPGTLTLEVVDEAFFKVTDGPGRPNCIMSHSRALRTYMKLCYDNGIMPDYMEFSWEDPMRGTVRGKVPSLHGVPWLVNDLAEISIFDGPPVVETSPIFFMLLGDNDGPGPGRGITGVIPQERVGDMFVTRQSTAADPSGKTVTVIDVTWPVTLAIGAKGALSVLDRFALTPNYVIPSP